MPFFYHNSKYPVYVLLWVHKSETNVLTHNTTNLPIESYKTLNFAWVCSKYEDFLFRGSILVSKLLKQEYYSRKLQTTFRKLYGRHIYLVHKFDTSVSHMLNGLLTNCDT